MKMKKLTAIALVSAMMLSVAGCGGKAESTSSDPAAAQEQDTEAAGETANEPEENPILKYEGADAEGYATFSTPSAVSGTVNTWAPVYAIGQCWYASVGLKYMFN